MYNSFKTKSTEPRACGVRSGITLIELLVVLGIFGLLAALILPAVQAARESSRRVQCTNNFKMIGLAIQSFESTHRHLPNVAPADGSRDARDPNYRRGHASITWRLLPWLDQGAVAADEADAFRQYPDGEFPVGADSPTARLHIPVLNCPSDVGGPGVNVRYCAGAVPHCYVLYGDDSAFAGLGAFSEADRPYQLSEISDGLSNTAAASEKLKGSQSAGSFSGRRDYWYSGLYELLRRHPGADELLLACDLRGDVPGRFFPFAGSTWQGTTYSTALYNHVAPPNDAQPDCSGSVWNGLSSSVGSYRASSQHGPVVNVLLLDGSVRAVGQNIDLGLWRGLGVMADGAARSAE